MKGRRILSVCWPHLAIERWRKTSDAAPDTPVVLTVEGPHGPLIHAVTRAAGERGARPGARLTDARALDPALVAIAADPAGDEALVRQLARWASRWSPLVEVDGPDGLRLEITGVAHLFGGETRLAEDVRQRFAAIGLTARVAIAPTPGAAWALSRFGPSPPVTPAKAGVQANASASRGRCLDPSFRWDDDNRSVAALLAPLPVAALRLSPQAVCTLERLGLKTIGTLSGIERRSLARRFRNADNPVDALDRALGRKPEPLTAAPFEPPPRATMRLEEPVADPSAAARALELLVPKLVKALQSRRLGVRRLALTGFRIDGSTAVASVGTSTPSREPKHLTRLIAEKAAALDPGFGFDAFALEASMTEPLGAAQHSLVDRPNPDGDVAQLVDRLSVKLGPGKVCRPQAHESHLPERASGWVAALFPSLSRERSGGGWRMKRLNAAEGASSRASSPFGITPPPSPSPQGEGRRRPQRLLDRPEAIAVVYATPEGLPRRFVWRRAVHDIARVEGPERIAPEWWRERSTARLRDYYRVEDSQGRRYWIYREGLAGDGRGGAPAWYLHGLFG